MYAVKSSILWKCVLACSAGDVIKHLCHNSQYTLRVQFSEGALLWPELATFVLLLAGMSVLCVSIWTMYRYPLFSFPFFLIPDLLSAIL